MNDLENWLTELGYEMHSLPGSNVCLVAVSENLLVRVLFDYNQMEFSRRKTFDRWANSKEYIVYNIPRNFEDLKAILEYLEYTISYSYVPWENQPLEIRLRDARKYINQKEKENGKRNKTRT